MPLVTLHDGRQVDSHSKEWQIECLARWALARPRADAVAFLESFTKRNERDGENLRKVMNALRSQARVPA